MDKIFIIWIIITIVSNILMLHGGEGSFRKQIKKSVEIRGIRKTILFITLVPILPGELSAVLSNGFGPLTIYPIQLLPLSEK